MQIMEKEINGKQYLYFSYYDKEDKKTKNEYCGQMNDPNSRILAYEMEKKLLWEQKRNLYIKIKILEQKITKMKSTKSNMDKLR